MNLATLQTIENLRSHPNADRLDLVNIKGYQCVTEKGLYKNGDQVIYIKTDTLLPKADWSEGYRKYSPNRVKAVSLRGEWSEGIIVPLEQVKHLIGDSFTVGDDVTDALGVLKWEAPIPQNIEALNDYLPYGIPATDESRWEEIEYKLPYGELVDETLKIDGSSCSYYYHLGDDKFGVLTRNQELKLDMVNNYTKIIKDLDIENKLRDFCKKHKVSLVIRGEIHGAKIRKSGKNQNSKGSVSWKMFSVYDIKARKYCRKGDKFYFVNVAKEMSLPTVDLISQDVVLTKELIQKYSSQLDILNGKPFEGVVINYSTGSFKVINKSYDSRK